MDLTTFWAATAGASSALIIATAVLVNPLLDIIKDDIRRGSTKASTARGAIFFTIYLLGTAALTGYVLYASLDSLSHPVGELHSSSTALLLLEVTFVLFVLAIVIWAIAKFFEAVDELDGKFKKSNN